MLWLSWVAIGAAVGLLVRFMMPGNDSLGHVGTVTMGAVGALLGGFLGRSVLRIGTNEFLNPEAMMAAAAGSLTVLVVYAMVSR